MLGFVPPPNALDLLGRPLEISVPGLHPVQQVYDNRGRRTDVSTGPVGDARTVHYDYHVDGPYPGALQRITDALGRSLHFEYDPAGRLTRQVLADGREVL